MNKRKKFDISIIVPVYNVEKYLNRCVNSILSQNEENIEIILVDDESPDNCPKICDKLCSDYEYIKVIHKKNGGLGLARNSGLEIAQGEYIWFVDSDDYISSESISILKKQILEYNKPDIICFGIRNINSNNLEIDCLVPQSDKKYYSNNNEIINELLPDFIFDEKKKKNFHKSSCCKLYNREFLINNRIKFHSERVWISEDYYFFMDAFYYVNSLLFIKEAFYNYYHNGNTLTTTYKKDRFKKLLLFYKKMDELIIEYNYPEECFYRFKGTFISNLIACLKMEAINKKNVGTKNVLSNLKTICSDDFVVNAVNTYKPQKQSWKILLYSIKKQHILLLYILLLIKNKM